MTVFDNSNQTRAFINIGDMALILAESIEIPEAYNQVFNIGADLPYTVKELSVPTGRAMDVEPNIVFLPALTEVTHVYSSHEKVQRFLGERDLHTLEEGLGCMTAWVKQRGVRSSQKLENFEVSKDFPKTWPLENPIDIVRNCLPMRSHI